MSESVVTNVPALTEFRTRLMRFDELLDEEYHAITREWEQLGDVWRDRKYEELGTALQQVGRGIERYLSEAPDHEMHLLRLIERAQEFLDT
jgi:hypothetical protein